MSENTQEKTTEPATGPLPDVVNNLDITCQELAQKYINNLDDPSEIKTNNGLFVGMLKYVYRYYLVDVLKNDKNKGNRYDFNLLNKLFYIYTDFVYKYKQNKRATIIEFSIFVNVSRDTLYNAALGLSKKLTQEDTDMIKKWFSECENSLTNNNGVFDMFLLKSHPVYRYNDNLAPVPLSGQGSVLALNELPNLGQIDVDAPQIPDKTTVK